MFMCTDNMKNTIALWVCCGVMIMIVDDTLVKHFVTDPTVIENVNDHTVHCKMILMNSAVIN